MSTPSLGRFARAVLLAIAVVLATTVATARADRSSARTLVGSWVVTITALNWPGGPLPSWYRAYATFTGDGTIVQTVTDPFITTGHGVWARTRDHGHSITTFLTQFDPTGAFLGTIRATATIRVTGDGDEFIGDPYRFDFLDANGTVVLTGLGTAHGTRITPAASD